MVDVSRSPRSRTPLRDTSGLLEGYDLVVDAAFGTGCSRPYVAPKVAPPELSCSPSTFPRESTPTAARFSVSPWWHRHDRPRRVQTRPLLWTIGRYVGELHFAGLGIVTSTRGRSGRRRRPDESDHFERRRSQMGPRPTGLRGLDPHAGGGRVVLRGALAGGASMIRLVSRGDVATQVRVPPEVVHLKELG